LAGLPAEVITRAREVLALLEGEAEHLVPALAPAGRAPRTARPPDADQLALFAVTPHAVVGRLRQVDVNTLTPLAALQLVAELADQARA
jgi:DNA mismatch repair protein MutS